MGKLPTSRAVVLALLAGTALAAPGREEALRAEFAGRKRDMLVEAAQEHLRIGVWCRDAGLVPQATAEFLRAVEVAEGQHPGALKVLALMRGLDERFWRTVRAHPSAGLLAKYDRRAGKAFETLQKQRLALAAWALRYDELQPDAIAEYRAIVRDSGGALEFDAKRRVVVATGALPEEVSTRLADDAIEINRRLYVRDGFLALVPEVGPLSEAASDEVRVRSARGPEATTRLHAAARALWPHLVEDVGGRPTRLLDVFVFETHAQYDAYLDAAGLKDFTVATGFADGARDVAVICGEGLGEEDLTGVVMHELAHLFQYEVTPVVMPSWYAEGFAEHFGGPGTFSWKDGKLEPCGMLDPARLAPLKTDDGFLPLTEFLGGDALALLTTDKERGHRFYAEAWAFYRFLRTDADKPWRERFAQWETMCRGAALGAEAGKPYSRDTAPAASLFQRMFGDDLARLETDFRAWLAGL